MGIGWRSNEGSDSLPNLSRGENLGAHGSNKSNIQVVYHAQPITTSQQWLPAAPSLKEFSYDGLPIALNGTDRYYNISEFQYGSSLASELFKVTVNNIDYDPTYGGSLTLRWEARLSNNKPTNGNQLKDFTIQLTLPAPNAEIAKEVANKAQSLIDQFGYYQFLNLVDFMQRNPGAVSFGLNLINKR